MKVGDLVKVRRNSKTLFPQTGLIVEVRQSTAEKELYMDTTVVMVVWATGERYSRYADEVEVISENR